MVANKMFHVEQFIGGWLYRVLIFIQLLALSFSFSKSAIIAFIIGLVMLIFGICKMFHVEHFNNNAKNVPRGTIQIAVDKCSTWNIYRKSIESMFNKMFHVEHLFIIWGIIVAGMVLFFINLKLFI